jgi:hypothetical protein
MRDRKRKMIPRSSLARRDIDTKHAVRDTDVHVGVLRIKFIVVALLGSPC